MENSENTVIRKMICIMCPASCHLEITEKGKEGEYLVTGNRCPGGKNYALNEMRDPKRIVTAVVASDSTKIPCIPVKTDLPLQMDLIRGLLQKLFSMKIHVPVQCGDVLIKNYKDTGVSVVITRSVEE
ncbi:MAG: DUF1667 domain-containing protein [Lentisphaeria bacterium]|nr:DUF1667 domain-containing protein [Lentisphaeria bacterium]